MLRIDTQTEDGLISFSLEGKLAGRWVRELEQCWQEAVSSQPAKPIQVKLCAVGFIDSDGRELLTRMRRQGAMLVPTGCLMKVIVQQIEDEVGEE